MPVSVPTEGVFEGEVRLPAMDVTAARSADGAAHVAIVNVDPDERAEVDLDLDRLRSGSVSGQVPTARRLDSHNTFGEPNAVVPAAFSDGGRKAAGFDAARSVGVL